MWRTILKHDLLDANIRNFHAPPGSANIAALALDPLWDPHEKRYGLRMDTNKAFVYTLQEPVQDTIGVSLRARLRFFAEVAPQKYPLFQLGNALSVGLWGGDLDHHRGEASIAFFLGENPGVVLGKVTITTARPIDYRVDWHTSGQLKVYFDGALVAYHNAVGPGHQFAFSSVAFGMAPHAMPAGQGYTLSAISVKCLQRQTMLRKIARRLPDIPIPPQMPIRCASMATSQVLRQADRLRAFMAKFHAVATQPWVQGEGAGTAPFTQAAVEAHSWALKAGSALGGMMRDWDFSQPERFLDPIGEFFRIAHATLPVDFAELASDMVTSAATPTSCTVPEEKIDDATRYNYAGLVQLMERTRELINTIAQGA